MLNIVANADVLAATAAEMIITTCQQAVRERGRCTIALAGGSTPERTYKLLTEPERSARIDWSNLWVFFGDERCVPLDDPRSNFAMAQRSLLKAPLPPAQIFPIATTGATPADAAAAYARTLAEAFPGSAPPRFDVILLGLGDDGHTASLFPGKPALHESAAWVTWSPPGVLPPPVDRVTFTFPVLNAAREVLFLVAGANKAVPLRDILEGKAKLEQHPAAGVQPSEGTLTWLVDETAASLLGQAGKGIAQGLS